MGVYLVAQADKEREGFSLCERRLSVLPLIVDAAFCALALPLAGQKTTATSSSTLKWVYSMYILESAMQTRIQRWGNSLGLRIPKAFAEQAGVEAGSEVDLALEDGALTIRPAREPKYGLAALVRGITDENVHAEVETGPPVGREVW